MAARFKMAGLMMSYDVITNTYVLSCASDMFRHFYHVSQIHFVAFHSLHFQSLKGFRWSPFGPQYEIGRQVYIIKWNVKETIEIEAAYT